MPTPTTHGLQALSSIHPARTLKQCVCVNTARVKPPCSWPVGLLHLHCLLRPRIGGVRFAQTLRFCISDYHVSLLRPRSQEGPPSKRARIEASLSRASVPAGKLATLADKVWGGNTKKQRNRNQRTSSDSSPGVFVFNRSVLLSNLLATNSRLQIRRGFDNGICKERTNLGDLLRKEVVEMESLADRAARREKLGILLGINVVEDDEKKCNAKCEAGLNELDEILGGQ
eukprot:6482989-Amphidinium_carterae.1